MNMPFVSLYVLWKLVHDYINLTEEYTYVIRKISLCEMKLGMRKYPKFVDCIS